MASETGFHAVEENFTFELFHLGDQEPLNVGGLTDITGASAVLNALRDQDLGNDGIEDNTLVLSSGDIFIPGTFYSASEAAFGSSGIASITIQNLLGIQASALGNHEFDDGTANLAALIDGSAPGEILGADYAGADFTYLSTNLDFSTDINLAPLEVAAGQAPIPRTVTSSVVFDVNGEQVGVIGAITPTLASISSPGDLAISPGGFDTNPTPEQLDALAAVIQAGVDELLEANPGLNKVVLLSHFQLISIEQAIAERLTDVDIIVGGGSNTRLFDNNDRIRDGDTSQGEYPTFITNAGGTQTALVNTDGSYKYLGRLVLEFDADGNIIPESYNPEVSGAYATDAQGVADLGAEDLVDTGIQEIVDTIEEQIILSESNILGNSDVFLNGNRSGDFTADNTDGVRTQETNLGNLTADANLAAAQELDETVVVSLKNGGGIRASIGESVVPAGGGAFVRTPNPEIVDSNGNVVKPEGGISENDIAATLAFNNGLTLLTLTKQELVDLLDYGVSILPEIGGQFPQISGVKFSFDQDAPAGSKIQSAAIVDSDNNLIAELVRDGALVGDPNQEFRTVTLNFLAEPRFDEETGAFIGGGDGYPFPNIDDPAIAARVNPVFLEQEGVRTGDATFADDGTEQDALAEFLLDNFATAETAFNQEDVGPAFDERIQNLAFRDDTVLDNAVEENFTFELFHLGDQEPLNVGGLTDITGASAVLNALRDQDLGNDGIEDNTLVLSSGDIFIPGTFYSASEAAFGSSGIASITIQNLLGIQASALGNHEFDDGTANLAALIDGSAPGEILGADYAGADFTYLSTNLDFSTDINLAPLEVAAGQAPIPRTVTSSVVFDVNGEQVGVIGAITPTLASISSPGDLAISPGGFDTNPTPEQLDALAAVIQAGVDELLEANPGLNKVVLLSHFQLISIEQAIAERLTDVDIIVGGGSNTRLFDNNDRIRDGDTSQGEYPTFITNAGGTQTALVNTDGSYKYLGRLVLEFDADGNIIPESYNPEVSGAYATDAQGVADLGAEDLVDTGIQEIVDTIEEQIILSESNILGNSDVFLNGNRSGDFTADNTDGVRTQETNLGNLTADANLAAAQELDETVVVSLKNGGGIRASIGESVVPAGGGAFVRTPNPEIVDSNGNVVKPEGGISENDIAATLAFNNGLTLLTLTKQELVDLLDYGVSILPEIGGQFPQISGVKFSFDQDAPAGSKIQSAAIVDSDNNLIAELVRDGALVGDPNQEFRTVTLNFLAEPRFDEETGAFIGGGDGYPFPNIDDPAIAARVNPVFLEQEGVRTGDATFADDGTEQDALAEFLLDNFATAETAFNQEDVGPAFDERIQNLAFRDDTVLDNAEPVVGEISSNDNGSVVAVTRGGDFNFTIRANANAAATQDLVAVSTTEGESRSIILSTLGTASGTPAGFDFDYSSTENLEADSYNFALRDSITGDLNFLTATAVDDGEFELNGDGIAVTTTTDLLSSTTEELTLLGETAEAIDLSDLANPSGDFTLQLDATLFREAAFDNQVGFYLANRAGSVLDPLTGEEVATLEGDRSTYLDAVVNNTLFSGQIANNNSGGLDTSEATISGNIDFNDAVLLPFLVRNGTLSDVASNFNNLYVAPASLNADNGTDHIRLLGGNTFGFEDQRNAGDSDFDDVVVVINNLNIV